MTKMSSGGEKRIVLRLPAPIAPVKAMVAPLLKNKPELVAKAREVRAQLQKVHPAISWTITEHRQAGYRRQDEIGTPFCITIDFDTWARTRTFWNTVTLRHRIPGVGARIYRRSCRTQFDDL